MNIQTLKKVISLLDEEKPTNQCETASINTSVENPMIGKKVLIRSNMAGVHVGTLHSQNGNAVILTNAIRLYNWTAKQGIALSGVAVHGSSNKKIDCEVEMIQIFGCDEIILCGKDSSYGE